MLIGVDASRALRAQRTGTEAYSLHLIRALQRSTQAHQHRLRLYLPSPAPAGLFSPAAHVEARVIRLPRLWTHLRLSAEMLMRAPDALFVPAHVLPLIHPRRSLVTVHDLGYRYFPEAHPALQRWYLDVSTRWSARAAQALLADSEATRADLVKWYGVDPAKIHVVYPGYDESLRRTTAPEDRARVYTRYGVKEPYVIHLGTVHPRKNLIRLIAALDMLRDVFPSLQLVLAGGEGWLTRTIRGVVHKLRLDERVRFTGYVAAEDVAPLLSGARACVFPSLHEGFGFPALEAQACGTPLVAARASSLPEVAGEGALYIDPLDTPDLARGLRTVLEDEALRADLIARGTANLARFSWAQAAERTLAVLEGLR